MWEGTRSSSIPVNVDAEPGKMHVFDTPRAPLPDAAAHRCASDAACAPSDVCTRKTCKSVAAAPELAQEDGPWSSTAEELNAVPACSSGVGDASAASPDGVSGHHQYDDHRVRQRLADAAKISLGTDADVKEVRRTQTRVRCLNCHGVVVGSKAHGGGWSVSWTTRWNPWFCDTARFDSKPKQCDDGPRVQQNARHSFRAMRFEKPSKVALARPLIPSHVPVKHLLRPGRTTFGISAALLNLLMISLRKQICLCMDGSWTTLQPPPLRYVYFPRVVQQTMACALSSPDLVSRAQD